MQALKDNHPKFLRRGSLRVVVVFRAFSLMEVLICAAILAILGGIAAPRIAESNARARVNSAAQAAAALIDRIATEAEASGSSRVIRFGNDGVIESCKRDGSEVRRFDLGVEPWRTVITGADFDGDAELTIDGFGESDSDGYFLVRSSNYIARVEWTRSSRQCDVRDLAPARSP